MKNIGVLIGIIFFSLIAIVGLIFLIIYCLTLIKQLTSLSTPPVDLTLNQSTKIAAKLEDVNGNTLSVLDTETGKKYSINISDKTNIIVTYNYQNIPEIKQAKTPFKVGQSLIIDTPPYVGELKSEFTSNSITVIVELTLSRGNITKLTPSDIEVQLFKDNGEGFWKITEDVQKFIITENTQYFTNSTTDISTYAPLDPNDINLSQQTDTVYVYSYFEDQTSQLSIADLIIVIKPGATPVASSKTTPKEGAQSPSPSSTPSPLLNTQP